MESIKIGELEIPKEYWKISDEDKRELCLTIIDGILQLINKHIDPSANQNDVLVQLIESSIITNEIMENYEICQVLLDLRNIINE